MDNNTIIIISMVAICYAIISFRINKLETLIMKDMEYQQQILKLFLEALEKNIKYIGNNIDKQ